LLLAGQLATDYFWVLLLHGRGFSKDRLDELAIRSQQTKVRETAQRTQAETRRGITMENAPSPDSISLFEKEQSDSGRPPAGTISWIFSSFLQVLRQMGGNLGGTVSDSQTNGLLPRFISFLRHGESDFAAPLIATNDSLFGFVLESDRNSVQQFVDATLGATSSGITYRVLGDHVILLFQHCGHFTSPDNIGWAEDRETAILVPLIEHKPRAILPEKLVIWIPYLLIDVGLGMVTGRDVWGYNKTLGTTSMPKDPGDKAEFKCQTLIFRTFDRDTQARMENLITVTAVGNLGPLAEAWRDATEVVKALRHTLGEFRLNWKGAETAFDLVHTLLNRDVPVINLKQMRDSQQTRLASFQALVETNLEIKQFHGGGPLAGSYEVEFCDCESHAIARDFGFKLSNGKMPAKFAFWAKLDFNAPPGTTVWQAR